MEVALKRLEGVDKISISISQQKFQLTFKGGASFQPAEIREAVAKADVGVVRFRITARGYIEEDKGKQFFVAGKDKFLVTSSPKIASETSTWIEAAVDDSTEPVRLKVLQFKSVK